MNKIRFDIEVTTHCNAECNFCPREAIPFLQHMSLEMVDGVIDRIRALHINPAITLCGTGDCSTHPHLSEIVARFTSVFDDFSIVTNGARINRERAEILLKNGLKKVIFSVTEHGDDYDRAYNLPFDKTLQNIKVFRELAGDQCKVVISLMSRRFLDPEVKRQKVFWQEMGFRNFLVMKYTNRAGALVEQSNGDDSISDHSPAMVHCMVPFWSTFIGADGGYYLCSHDFRKLRSFGRVDRDSIASAWSRKKNYFSEDGSVCSHCTANPQNFLPEMYKDKSSEAMLERYWGDRNYLMPVIENEISIDGCRQDMIIAAVI